jgi:WD40 repeat protein
MFKYSLIPLIFLILIPSHAQNSVYIMESLQVISSENIDSLEQIASINTASNQILDIEWSPDGNYLALVGVSDKPRVEIWDFQNDDVSLNPVATFAPQLVRSIHWLPDSRHLATHGKEYTNGNLRSYAAIWDTVAGDVVATLVDTEPEPSNCCDPIAQPIVGWNSNYSVATAIEDNHTFRLTTGDVFTFRDPTSLLSSDFTEEPAFGTIVNAEWSPHDRYIAVEHATQDQYRFHIVDAQTLQSVLYFFGEDYWTCNLMWSPDDTTLAVISETSSAGLPATRIRLYPVEEPVCYGGCGIELWIDSENLNSRCNPAFAWSPDSLILSIGTATTLDFYEPSEMRLMYSFPDKNILELGWHPTQKIITSDGTHGIIRLWGVPERD